MTQARSNAPRLFRYFRRPSILSCIQAVKLIQ